MTVGHGASPRSRVWVAAGLGVVFVAYSAMVLSAAADAPELFTALFMVVLGLELLGEREAPWLAPALRGVQFGVSSRGLIAAFTFGLLVARHFEHWSTTQLVVVIALVLCLPLSRSMCLLALTVSRTVTSRPVLARNIDLDPGNAESRLPGLHVLLGSAPDRRLVFAGALPLLVGAGGVIADRIWPFALAAAAYTLALLVVAALVASRVWRGQGRGSQARWEARALERIRALRPEVILYFSGSPDAAYQINMWLGPLARLARPSLVLLRERHVLDNLAPTELPVACMPSAVTVMSAKLGDARVALYPANTSKNIHLLREPGIRHVFIGHGDSDKVSSINPFAKVYDQVWVAGRAGRDRWAAAGVGVRDEAIVEVGRPQLDAVRRTPRSRAAGAPLAVLYAPTWEGWNDEDFTTSLTHMGPTLIKALLAAQPRVRILYKPHPFTGTRDPRARKAHERIVRALTEANRPAVTTEATPAEPPGDGHGLAQIEQRLAAPGLRPDEADELADRWSQHFWARQGDVRHVVIDGPRPSLFDCFDHADVLVADVSSVVSDFLATGKPYVCANTRGLDHQAFRTQNPSAGAAYLLGPDCTELDAILADVHGPDPLAAERAQLRAYLLGPDEPSPIERWKAALDALAATAPARAQDSPGIDPDAIDQPVDPPGQPVADTATDPPATRTDTQPRSV